MIKEWKTLSNKPKGHVLAMGRTSNSKLGATRCKKHPKHQQSPGVCSLCLTQRLSQLANTGCSISGVASATMGSSSSSSSVSSLSSYYSSSSASSSSSPYLRRHIEGKSSSISMSLLFKTRSSSFLTTSRSLASRFRGKDHQADDEDHKERKKLADGFWSKLIMNRRGKEIVEETLRHSTSTTDQSTTAS